MHSTHYLSGKPFEVEDIGRGQVKIWRNGSDYSVTTTAESVRRWQAGEYIQSAMPFLDADQREFLMSGLTPDQFNAIFGDGEE